MGSGTETEPRDVLSLFTLSRVTANHCSKSLSDLLSNKTCYNGFLVTFAVIARMFSGNHLYLFFFQTMIASCSSATYDWDSDNIQESDPILLEADKPYYLEAYHNDFGGGHNVKIRVRLDKTEHTNSKVGAARDERQKITISSTVLWEKQVCL